MVRQSGPVAAPEEERRGGGVSARSVHDPLGAPEPTSSGEDAGEGRVAYIMSRFPKLTETFVLYEMAALERLGARVEVFPLMRHRSEVHHPEARAFVERAHYLPLLSWGIAMANLRSLVAAPRRYLRTWWEVVRGAWGSPRYLLGGLAFLPKCVAFAERMRSLGVTHVHAHFASHPAAAAFIIHRLTGIPYSFTAHGSDLHRDRCMLREKVHHCAFAVTISDYNRELMVQECGPRYRDRIHVIHCGVDGGLFAPEVGRGQGEPARLATRIVCVASLDEVKGHRYLLDACALLRDRGVEVRCDCVGDGPLRASLARRARDLGVEESFRLLGPLARRDVARLVRSADVAVLASYPTASGRREGIPVFLMEAMASGLPVVASALSGIPELVEHGRTGLLVPPGDPWALADALELLHANRDMRERMGTLGRAHVLSEFEQEAGARMLLDRIREEGAPSPVAAGAA